MAQVTFSGEVVFVHQKFVAVKEDGEYGKRFQVWNVTANKGDRVTVTGELKTSVAKPREEGEIPKYVDHAVNNATIAAQAGTQTPVQAPPAEWDQEQWGTPALGDFDASTPF